MKTITVCNQKGGVGKTTTVLTIAAGLVRRGDRALVVDFDPQCTTTALTAGRPDKTILDVINGTRAAAVVIVHADQGFDVLPGDAGLASVPADFQPGQLRELLQPIAQLYDYCVIDTGPGLSLLSISALCAADHVIIPCETDIGSLQGLDAIAGTLGAVRPLNKGLRSVGVLVTKYRGYNIDKTMLPIFEERAAEMDAIVYKTVIRLSNSFKTSQLFRDSIFDTDPRGNGSADYTAFLDEFMKGGTNG